MTTATLNQLVEQKQEQSPMAIQPSVHMTIENQNKEQSMNYATTSFLMASPQPSPANDIIVHNKDGVDIKQSLQNVSAMATTWHKNSTRQLYAVLGQCYELYYLIETADSSQRDKYRDSVTAAYKALSGEQGAKKLLSRIVSVIFNFADLDRRQRSRYGMVISTAYKAEQKPTDAASFVSWLERTGGIVAALDKPRNGGGKKIEQSFINDAVRAMPTKAILSVPNEVNKFVVLLANPVDSNTVEVLYQFEEDSVGDLLATKAYKAEQKLAKEAEKRASAVEAADELAKEVTAQEGV